MDRRLLGITVLAATWSTVAILLVAVWAVVPEPIEVLRVDFPEYFIKEGVLAHEQTVRYGLIARRQLDHLTIKFTSMSRRQLEDSVHRDLTLDPRDFPTIRSYIEKYGGYPTGYEHLSSDVIYYGQNMKMEFFDFGDTVECLVPDEKLLDAVTCFALIYHPNGSLAYYFEGYPNFFNMQGMTLRSLSISLNENETRFLSRAPLAEEDRRLSELPHNGTLKFRHLQKGSVIQISYNIKSGAGQYPDAYEIKGRLDQDILQVIRVYASLNLAQITVQAIKPIGREEVPV